jgi:hypothetical protein
MSNKEKVLTHATVNAEETDSEKSNLIRSTQNNHATSVLETEVKVIGKSLLTR